MVQKILGGVKKTMDVPLLLSLLLTEKQASTSLVVCIFNKKYSPLLLTQTLANSYLALEPKSLSSGFWSFTTILPWITGTLDLDNLNPQKTGSNFCVSSGHSLYLVTLNNSNHVCRYVISQKQTVYCSPRELNLFSSSCGICGIFDLFCFILFHLTLCYILLSAVIWYSIFT